MLVSWAWVADGSSVEGSDVVRASKDLAAVSSEVREVILVVRDVFSVLLVSRSAVRVEMRLSRSEVVDSAWKRKCLKFEMSSSSVSIVACFVLS